MIKALLFNWEYKLIALLLAVALYVYTSDLITVEKYILISNPSQDPDVIVYHPEDFIVTSITPGVDIEMRVSGPRTIIENMEKTIPLRLKLTKDLIREGKQIYPVSNLLLGLDPSVTIISATPRDDIVVHVSRVKFKNIPLALEAPDIVIEGYPDSLMPAVISLDDITSLEVSGAEDVIDTLNLLYIEPISFTSLNLKAEDVRVELKQIIPVKIKPYAGVQRTDTSQVYATIIIKPKQSHRDMNLKVQIQAP
ncbi:MAG: hypothetical protein HRU15_05045, partial [Planctomycetes bacterium]|nr:hypothetical protein [Planctomycetota bacterium]